MDFPMVQRMEHRWDLPRDLCLVRWKDSTKDRRWVCSRVGHLVLEMDQTTESH